MTRQSQLLYLGKVYVSGAHQPDCQAKLAQAQ